MVVNRGQMCTKFHVRNLFNMTWLALVYLLNLVFSTGTSAPLYQRCSTKNKAKNNPIKINLNNSVLIIDVLNKH